MRGWGWLLGCWSLSAQAQIPCGHAHNDYAQGRRPLYAAVEAGMRSIEIDVYPRRGKLKVAHLPFFLAGKPDIEELYIRPLASDTLLLRNRTQPLILMVDIKRQPEEAHRLLLEIAQRYPQLWQVYGANGDTLQRGRVELLLSGSKPWTAAAGDTARYMRLDAGLGQLGSSDFKADLAPRISMRYPFRWRGKGEMPEEERAQLRAWIEQAHADGRQLRFWAMPQNETVWDFFWKSGVDWLNIDDIQRFKQWWESKQGQ